MSKRSVVAVRSAIVQAVLGLGCVNALALPSADEAPYMSADCVRMADALRDVQPSYRQPRSLQDLRNTYAEQCTLEESRARRQASEAKRRNWDKEWEARAAELRQRNEAENAKRVLSAQCAEMHLALENRRKRAAANPGEVQDLQMFDKRFADRCG